MSHSVTPRLSSLRSPKKLLIGGGDFFIGLLIGLALAGGLRLVGGWNGSGQSWRELRLPEVTKADLTPANRANGDKGAQGLLAKLNGMAKDEAMDQIRELDAVAIGELNDGDCLRLLAGLSSDDEIEAMWQTILKFRYESAPESCVRLISAAAKQQWAERELGYVLANLAVEVDGIDATGVLLDAGAPISWTKRIIVDKDGQALPWWHAVDRFYGGKWPKEAFATAASFLTREIRDPSEEPYHCVDRREFLQNLSGKLAESRPTLSEQVEISQMIAQSRLPGLFSDWMEGMPDGYRRNRIIGDNLSSWVQSGTQGADERDQSIMGSAMESGDLSRKLIANVATGRTMADGVGALGWAAGIEDAESRSIAIDKVIQGQAGYSGASTSLLSAIAHMEGSGGSDESWRIVERVAQIESARLGREFAADDRALEAIRLAAGENWARIVAYLNANGIEASPQRR